YSHAKSSSNLVAANPFCHKLLNLFDNLRGKFCASAPNGRAGIHHPCTLRGPECTVCDCYRYVGYTTLTVPDVMAITTWSIFRAQDGEANSVPANDDSSATWIYSLQVNHGGRARYARPLRRRRLQAPRLDLAQRQVEGASWSTSDPPPLKWSDLRYVFDIQEDCNGKEAIQARRDCREAAAGRCSGLAGPEYAGRNPPDRGERGDVLSVAPGVWRAEVRAGEAPEGP